MVDSGAQGAVPELAGGRGRASSGDQVILHFPPKMVIFLCVY